jgi:hypothetical protein
MDLEVIELPLVNEGGEVTQILHGFRTPASSE